MRSYMIAFWIFLTLSVPHFALAAPVAMGEIIEVHSNPVQVLTDGRGMATWEKRMGPYDEDQSPTKDVPLANNDQGKDSDHPEDGPGAVKGGVDAEGIKEGSPFPWNSDDFGIGGWGPGASLDASYKNPPNNPPKEESDGGGGKDDGSDVGGGGGDHATIQSSQGSAENMSPVPQSEDPVAPKSKFTSFLEKLADGYEDPARIFRPRDFGSGAVGSTPKREIA